VAQLPTRGLEPWDVTLNEYLRVAHHDDGTLKAVRSISDFGDFTGGVVDALPTFRAAQALGPGRLIIPPGDYLFSSSTTSGGMVWQWAIEQDDLEILWAPGAKIISSVGNARVITALGSSKPAGMANWSSNQFVDATLYNLTGTQLKGDNKITLATPADASNFAEGDYIWIRTGQTLTTGTDQPESELNQVDRVDAAVGRLWLRWPLTRHYQQQYYLSGTSGATSTTVTANPAPYGVANVTDRTLVNITFVNPRIECGPEVLQVWSLWEGVNYRMAGDRSTFSQYYFGLRDVRFCEVAGSKIFHDARIDVSGIATSGTTSTLTDTTKSFTVNEHADKMALIVAGTGAGQGRLISSNTATALTLGAPALTTAPDATSQYVIVDRYYGLAHSTGCTDFDVHDNVWSSNYELYLHIHEGMAASRWHHNTVQNAWNTPNAAGVQVSGRSYDLAITHNLIYHNSDATGNAVLVSADAGAAGESGGVLAHNIVAAGRTAQNIRVDQDGWKGLDTNIFRGAGGTVSQLAASTSGAGHETGTRVASSVVKHSRQSVSLGSLPLYAIPLRVLVDVKVAFNSDGTDLLNIGYSTDDDAYVVGADLSTTGPKGPYQFGSAGAGFWLGRVEETSARSLTATYTNGGSEPTTGEALVMIEYALIARR
jgi:hypothetical protein